MLFSQTFAARIRKRWQSSYLGDEGFGSLMDFEKIIVVRKFVRIGQAGILFEQLANRNAIAVRNSRDNIRDVRVERKLALIDQSQNGR